LKQDQLVVIPLVTHTYMEHRTKVYDIICVLTFYTSVEPPDGIFQLTVSK
jgi:hypothetical protein